MRFQDFEDRRVRVERTVPIGFQLQRTYHVPIDAIYSLPPAKGTILPGYTHRSGTSHTLTMPYIQNVISQRNPQEAFYMVVLDCIQPEPYSGVYPTGTTAYMEVASSRSPRQEDLPSRTTQILGVATSSGAAGVPAKGDAFTGDSGTNTGNVEYARRCAQLSFDYESVKGLIFVKADYPGWNDEFDDVVT